VKKKQREIERGERKKAEGDRKGNRERNGKR
jgi:hypothetical protein